MQKPKKGEESGDMRNMHNKELHGLYSSLILMVVTSRMRWVGHAAHTEHLRNAYTVLSEKPQGKRPLGKTLVTRE